MKAILTAIAVRIKNQELEAAKKKFEEFKTTVDNCIFCDNYVRPSGREDGVKDSGCMLLEEKDFDCFKNPSCPVHNSEEECTEDCLAKRLDDFKENCSKREKTFEESVWPTYLNDANEQMDERIIIATDYLKQLGFFETKWWRNTPQSVKKCLIKEVACLSKTGEMQKSSFQRFSGVLDQNDDIVEALKTNSYISKDDLGDYTNPLKGTLIKLIKEVSEEIGTYEIRALVKINNKKYIV